MASPADLRLLLAAPAGSATAPLSAAVARLTAALGVDLTLVSLAGPDRVAPAHPEIGSEASLLRVQRLAREHDDPATTVADLCARQSFDLIMAPAEPGPALVRGWRGALRARVLARAGVPVWTGGAAWLNGRSDTRIRQVACLIDFSLDAEPILHRASTLARRLDAALHVVAMLPPVDDGLLVAALAANAPLLPDAALERIEHLCGSRFRPTVDVVVGGRREGLDALRRRQLPDLLFVQAHTWTGPWPMGVAGAIDRLGCAVVLVPQPVRRVAWSFETPLATATDPVAAPRPRPERRDELSSWPAGTAATY